MLDSATTGLDFERAVHAFDPSDPEVCDVDGALCDEDTLFLDVPPEMDLGTARSALVALAASLDTPPAGTALSA